DELNSLGVRVSALENKVGNVKLSGDARVRYQNQNDSIENDDSFDYKVDLVAEAQVNDRTKVTYGLSTNDVRFADNNAASAGSQDDGSANPYTNLANVEYQAGSHVTLLAGRYDYQIGNGLGLQYSDTFDGAQATLTSGNFALTGGYGKFKEGSGNEDDNGDATNDLLGLKAGYVSLDGTFGNVGAGVYYTQFNHSGTSDAVVGGDYAKNLDNVFGGYLSLNFGEKWNLLGDYQKVSKDDNNKVFNGVKDEDADLWGAKLTYGAADQAVKGSWDAWVEYINADQNALYGSTASWRSNDLVDNVKSWGVGVDYTLSKNVVLTVAQSFASEAKVGNDDPEELTDVELNFFF
uniref:S-layer homology domain-containing protein n=1 Tax=uncultured Megasphaera sp. TaxID=165188 RepID=UPI0026594DFA